MTAVLLAGFILYFYVPHLFFKAAVTLRYEMTSRKGLPQVEEFFAAALPSVFLHLKTLLAINIVTLLTSRSWFIIDRRAIALFFTDKPDLQKFVSGGDLQPALLYYVLLGTMSFLTGFRYSKVLIAVATAGGTKRYIEQFQNRPRAAVFVQIVRMAQRSRRGHHLPDKRGEGSQRGLRPQRDEECGRLVRT